jgi:hypothetical protein
MAASNSGSGAGAEAVTALRWTNQESQAGQAVIGRGCVTHDLLQRCFWDICHSFAPPVCAAIGGGCLSLSE